MRRSHARDSAQRSKVLVDLLFDCVHLLGLKGLFQLFVSLGRAFARSLARLVLLVSTHAEAANDFKACVARTCALGATVGADGLRA